MSSSNHPIIVPFDFDIEDAFSSTNSPNYLPVFPDYFPTIPRNNSPNSSNDFTEYLLDTLVFSPLHDDPYMEAMQAYNVISSPQEISPPKDVETPVESSIPVSLSLSVDLHHRLVNQSSRNLMSQMLVRMIILGNNHRRYPSSSSKMPPKRTSTSATPAMIEAAIRQLITEGVAAVLEAQAAAMANAYNPNRNPGPRETPIAKRGN
nr:hypothetical protein [Tanacetum cinerariifolium]